MTQHTWQKGGPYSGTTQAENMAMTNALQR
uniref:Uncharacterized protein n=1 Tax=Anguilla anguilla TaxID=7936 RepID=A0A0E9UET6_ANGAN